MSAPAKASATGKLLELATLKREPPHGANREAEAVTAGETRVEAKAKLSRKREDDKREQVEDGPDLHVTTDACERAITKDPLAFVRDGALGRLIRDELGSLVWRPYKPASAREAVGRTVRFFRFTRAPSSDPKGEPVKRFILPPESAIAALLDRGAWASARPLRRVTTAPFLRDNGTVCQSRGYDAQSQVFADFEESSFPRLPKRSSYADAKRALRELADVFVDFPFESEADRYVPIAAILSIVGRDAIRGPVPLVMISANVRGAGKSLLADVISIIATGRQAPGQAVPEADEEWQKALLSIARMRSPLVCFDNVRDGVPFGSAALDATLTSGAIAGRLLGGNENVTLESQTVFIATGNNPFYRGDLIRRVLPCRLRSTHENPEDRGDFQIRDVRAYAFEHRARLLVAALRLLSAYVESRERFDGRPWGSFERWSELITGAIFWVSGHNVQTTRETLSMLDDARGALDAMLASFAHWESPFTANEMLAHLNDDKSRKEILESFCPRPRGSGEINAKVLGRRLQRERDKVVDGRRFVMAGNHPKTKTTLWRVETVPS